LIVRVLGEEIPYAKWLLRILRDKSTPLREFRAALRRAGFLLAVEASEELPWRRVSVETPLGESAFELEPEPEPLVAAILGASLPMAEGVLDAYPSAPLALISARRVGEKEGNLHVEITYKRLPPRWTSAALVVDPMLATGMTIEKVVEELYNIGASKVVILTAISAPEGIKRLASRWPDLIIYTLAIDRRLNDKYFIVPGLGDAGDRGLGIRPS
jgi:uracil phosphoribosyltransferase